MIFNLKKEKLLQNKYIIFFLITLCLFTYDNATAEQRYSDYDYYLCLKCDNKLNCYCDIKTKGFTGIRAEKLNQKRTNIELSNKDSQNWATMTCDYCRKNEPDGRTACLCINKINQPKIVAKPKAPTAMTIVPIRKPFTKKIKKTITSPRKMRIIPIAKIDFPKKPKATEPKKPVAKTNNYVKPQNKQVLSIEKVIKKSPEEQKGGKKIVIVNNYYDTEERKTIKRCNANKECYNVDISQEEYDKIESKINLETYIKKNINTQNDLKSRASKIIVREPTKGITEKHTEEEHIIYNKTEMS